MSIIEILLTAIGLSMDAFATAICKGLAMKNFNTKKAILVGAYFGIFQALMPLVGYILGSKFTSMIDSIDHWIAFILLSIIGIGMLKEAYEAHKEGDSHQASDDTSFKIMLTLAIATSIDALAVGVTFAFLDVAIIPAVIFIGCVTFVISTIGVCIGHLFGSRYRVGAEIIGGLVLICLGIKILFSHLF